VLVNSRVLVNNRVAAGKAAAVYIGTALRTAGGLPEFYQLIQEPYL
jgi:hypothetical protein